MSNQRLMKVKEKAGDGYAKTNAIARGERGFLSLQREMALGEAPSRIACRQSGN